jgi:hypothetical protein
LKINGFWKNDLEADIVILIMEKAIHFRTKK